MSGGVRPISVLLVCQSYPPVLGGSEIEAQRVSAALIRRGYRVTVLCAGGPPMPKTRHWVDPEGVPVRIIGGAWLRDHAFALGVVWELLARRRSYDVVYFLMQGLHLAAGLPIAQLLGKPVVMKISGTGIITIMRRSRLGRAELRWLRMWARRVMLLNPGMFQEAFAAGFEERQLLWMPNPVDTDAYVPCGAEERMRMRTALGLPPEAGIVAFVGRLAPEKELASLIDAMALVVRKRPSAMLLLIGEGPLGEDLKARADGRLLSAACRFLGKRPPEQVRCWLQVSDVFALPSREEGLSCALLEAMSTALPSVVSAIPANTQLIEDGAQGLLVPVGDAPALANALSTLLSNPGLRARMGTEARARAVRNYSTASVIDRYEALLHEALKGAGED